MHLTEMHIPGNAPGSLEKLSDDLRNALRDEFSRPGYDSYPCIVATFPKKVIFSTSEYDRATGRYSDKIWEVGYSATKDGVSLEGEPKEVKAELKITSAAGKSAYEQKGVRSVNAIQRRLAETYDAIVAAGLAEAGLGVQSPGKVGMERSRTEKTKLGNVWTKPAEASTERSGAGYRLTSVAKPGAASEILPKPDISSRGTTGSPDSESNQMEKIFGDIRKALLGESVSPSAEGREMGQRGETDPNYVENEADDEGMKYRHQFFHTAAIRQRLNQYDIAFEQAYKEDPDNAFALARAIVHEAIPGPPSSDMRQGSSAGPSGGSPSVAMRAGGAKPTSIPESDKSMRKDEGGFAVGSPDTSMRFKGMKLATPPPTSSNVSRAGSGSGPSNTSAVAADMRK